jgi:uncharacterized protein YbjQ (UPF0145 family)
MTTITGLSGNEIFCLHQKGLTPGNIAIGNSVISLGMLRSLTSGLKTLVGGEVRQVTQIINEGRKCAYARMYAEATHHGGAGITGVSNQLIFHDANIEFLAIGSCVHRDESKTEQVEFSTAADGQSLYCQLDSGFIPKQAVFGNVAYSIGVGGGIMGSLKSLARGEVKEFSQIFKETRNLALDRIKAEAIAVGANAVVGIEILILPCVGMQEMAMIGTASNHPALPASCAKNPITSDLTSEEMWQYGSVKV